MNIERLKFMRFDSYHCVFYLHSQVEANKRELDVDWDQFYPLLQEILKRVPQLNETYLESLINTPEAFSPDCKWILGEAPEVLIPM